MVLKLDADQNGALLRRRRHHQAGFVANDAISPPIVARQRIMMGVG